MSTAERWPPADIPPLIAGERLNQAEFMRRYEATSPDFRAELIGGVVHVPGPVGRAQGRLTFDAIGWLGSYCVYTPGIDALGRTTTLMDEFSVPEPKAQLRIPPECGGQSRDEGEYVGGAPELVVEVTYSPSDIALGDKKVDYERAGAIEYIVVTCDPAEVHWFVRRGRKLVTMRRDHDGLYRSKVFPGLWLDPIALLRLDHDAVRAAVERGLASPEHAAFVDKLAAAARNV